MSRDKRKAQRRMLRHTAWILAAPDETYSCSLSDVSDSGARIDVEDSRKVPNRFFLMLSERGTVRRSCRVVWRKPNQLGVRFERAAAAPNRKAAAPEAEPMVEAIEAPATAAVESPTVGEPATTAGPAAADPELVELD